MHSRRPSRALDIVIGDYGRAAMLGMALASGVGLLLDFWIAHLHPLFSVGMLLLSVPVGLYWVTHRTIRMEHKQAPPDYIRNLALAAVAGQAGCSTVILVFMALFGGLYLDSRLNTHPVFTVVLVLLSIPVGLYAMVRLVLATTSKITFPPSGAASRQDFSAAQSSHRKENGL